jgi:hypothetical protein
MNESDRSHTTGPRASDVVLGNQHRQLLLLALLPLVGRLCLIQAQAAVPQEAPVQANEHCTGSTRTSMLGRAGAA